MIQFDEAVCRDLDLASRREWLETNGIGGFASSTISGLNTRRYHGLLVAATRPPLGRMVLLSKIEETLVIAGRRIDLSTNRYPGVVHPRGYRYLKRFRRDPFPVFVYEVDGVEVEKSVFMVHGENATVIQYEMRGAAPEVCALELRPLIAFRDYHYTTHENAAINASIQTRPGCVEMSPYPGLPSLTLSYSAGRLQSTGEWYRNFEYTLEEERGLDYREDLFNPLMLTVDLSPDQKFAIIASAGAQIGAEEADALHESEIARRAAVHAVIPSADPFVLQLADAADQFIVKRGDETTIIAGYHWFSDWGRDTMIALPGLTLSTGRYDAARRILLAFAANVDQGMIPNRFPDHGEAPEYNTVDATLWFFEAVRAFGVHTGDYGFIRDRLYPVLASIIAWHERGTRYGIGMDAGALLRAGAPGLQLTWMDVKVGDLVITPRYGMPVEIEALWYNALRVMEDFARRFGDSAGAHYGELAGGARESFNRLFWNEAAECLYDVIGDAGPDPSIRPNQVFAVSLFHKMLPAERAKRVVETVERHLLTPYGLRTLSPSDPQYRGRYEGDPASRDRAYHQGTVWPWLLGPFFDAYISTHGRSKETLDVAVRHLAALRRYIAEEGVGQIPEVFDGDAPHRPGGCIAQAWSVAELLRVCIAG